MHIKLQNLENVFTILHEKERSIAMEMQAPLARLSPDQIATINGFENQLAEKFGNPVILLAFDNKK